MRKIVKKISGYTLAFFVVLIVFFAVGISSLGSFVSTGGRLHVATNKKAYYQVTLEKNQTLDAVYLNVGATYIKTGKDVTVTVQYSTASVSSTADSWTTLGSPVRLAHIYSETGKNGSNYNWVKLTDGQKKTGVQQLALSADCNVDVNELICLDEKGEIIPLTASGRNSAYKIEEVNKTLDAQHSFRAKTGGYYNFTQDEAYMLESIDNLTYGEKTYEGGEYLFTGEHNYLTVLLFTPLTLLFGKSVFALRLTPFLATCVLLVFAWFLMRELTKNDKSALVFFLLLATGGLFTTLARVGSGYALVTSAIVASGYFAYKFFARGISATRVKRDGLNVFFSGLFSAFALAMDASAVFPVLGVVALLGFGLHRQNKAKRLALQKAETDQARAQAQRVFAYKTRVCYAYTALSLVAGTFFLLMIAGVACYSAASRAYGADIGFVGMLWKGVANSFSGGNLTEYTAQTATGAWGWWIPLQSTTLFDGVAVLSATQSVTLIAGCNVVLAILCPLAFVGRRR